MQYPDALRRSIAQCARRQTPLEVSLAGLDPALVESARAYRAFVDELLNDMAEAPEAYGFAPGAYEAHLHGRSENAAKRDEPARTQAVHASLMNAAHRYFVLLFRLAEAGAPDGDGLRLSAEDYGRIRDEYDRRRAPKKKTLPNEIPWETRLAALKRLDFALSDEADGGARIACARHPRMFAAMSALAKAAQNVKTYGEHNFCFTDFRQISSAHMQDWEDAIRPLPAEKRAVAAAIHEMLVASGLRPSVSTYWKVNYHYKGKHVACLDTDDGDGKRYFLVDHFRLRVDGSAAQAYQDAIVRQGADFQKFFEGHMNYCTACSTSHIGGQRQAFGRTVRLCCCPTVAFRISDPGMGDLPRLETVVRLRVEAIQRGEG